MESAYMIDNLYGAYMKFDCKTGALQILLHFPQQAYVQQISYEMAI
jgi:hypothetical protein